MKLVISNAKPRNPLVGFAQFRQAGSHRLSQGARRQQARRELRRELQSEKPPHS